MEGKENVGDGGERECGEWRGEIGRGGEGEREREGGGWRGEDSGEFGRSDNTHLYACINTVTRILHVGTVHVCVVSQKRGLCQLISSVPVATEHRIEFDKESQGLVT